MNYRTLGRLAIATAGVGFLALVSGCSTSPYVASGQIQRTEVNRGREDTPLDNRLVVYLNEGNPIIFPQTRFDLDEVSKALQVGDGIHAEIAQKEYQYLVARQINLIQSPDEYQTFAENQRMERHKFDAGAVVGIYIGIPILLGSLFLIYYLERMRKGLRTSTTS